MKVLRAFITRRFYDTDHLLTKTCETVVNIPDQFYQSVVLEKRRTLCSHILGASTAVFLGKGDDFSIQLVDNLTVELGRDLGQIVKQYLGMKSTKKGKRREGRRTTKQYINTGSRGFEPDETLVLDQET